MASSKNVLAAAKKGGRGSALDQALSKRLPGFDATEVKSVAKIVASLQSKGLSIDDAFPNGIVNPDSVTISGNLTPEKLAILGDLIKSAGSIKKVDVFPRGIPANPDIAAGNFFRVKLTINR